MAALFAIAAWPVHAAEVTDYRPVFQACRETGGAGRLAIRGMEIGGRPMLLTVDPSTLDTKLESATGLSCVETTDGAQKATRFVQTVLASTGPKANGAEPEPGVNANGGLVHGAGEGIFVTGDLCPSRRKLDRAFLESLAAAQPGAPVALSISGLWLTHHPDDFAWLQAEERAGKLTITWTNHSYTHPYDPNRGLAGNFLLTPGVDMQAEILDTEKLLIAHDETPSVFFRFPGLIANPALMQAVRNDHLIVLGADAWLAKEEKPHPGSIVLVHVNGNEPAGLQIFSDLLTAKTMPRPFRPIEAAP